MHRSVALILCVWLCSFIVASAAPFTTNSSTSYNGTYLSVEAWHARSLTDISWRISSGLAHFQDRVAVFWDKHATELVRFGTTVTLTNRSAISSSSSSTYTLFLEMGAGSHVCNYTAYETDQRNAFYNATGGKASTVTLDDSRAWWYTSSLAQETNQTDPSDHGRALVLLSDPGIYFVCLILANDSCNAVECLEMVIYQPPYDFMEVRLSQS